MVSKNQYIDRLTQNFIIYDNIHSRINARSHMHGTQVFKAFLHVVDCMKKLNRPLLRLPPIAFIIPIRSTTQILAGRRPKEI